MLEADLFQNHPALSFGKKGLVGYDICEMFFEALALNVVESFYCWLTILVHPFKIKIQICCLSNHYC